MPSLSSKDRVSLCRFTFDDGRRCRTPRISTSPDFCFYHAQKEAQHRATESHRRRISPSSSPATTSPPTTSTPPSAASSSPSLAAT